VRLIRNSGFSPRGRASRLRLREEDGATLVEFAFVVILLLTTLFGIMGFGQALYSYHFVNHAAKEGARWASVNGSTCNNDSSCNGAGYMNNGPASAGAISTYVQNLVPPGITAANVVTTAAWPVQTNSPTICSAAVGTQPATSNYPGCTVQVQVAYAFNFIFPLLPTSSSATAPCTQPGLCMSSTAEMIIVH